MLLFINGKPEMVSYDHDSYNQIDIYHKIGTQIYI